MFDISIEGTPTKYRPVVLYQGHEVWRAKRTYDALGEARDAAQQKIKHVLHKLFLDD